MIIILLLLGFSVNALEIVKPSYSNSIELTIIRAFPDELSSYTLTHLNSRNMDMTCAGRVLNYEKKKAFIRYRNFYNEVVSEFEIEDNRACLHLGKFIEAVHYGIDEDNPLRIILDRRKKIVSKIIYPNLDPYTDHGDVMDLFKKPPVIIKMPRNPIQPSPPKVTKVN